MYLTDSRFIFLSFLNKQILYFMNHVIMRTINMKYDISVLIPIESVN